jgi:MYXO-CTERM domain-containing protein
VAACAELTLHFFDPDSAPIVALLLLALGMAVAARRGGQQRAGLISGCAMVAFPGVWLVLRPAASRT